MRLNLQTATLIKRYKRFLADVELATGEIITIHCPNTGAMTGCTIPGSTVYFSTSENPKRKYPNTWELCHTPDGDWITVNTNRANDLVFEAFTSATISEFFHYKIAHREVKYGENSRADLLLTGENIPRCFVEVKSVTLLENGRGFFPDAVTTRGQKHLQELIKQVEAGHQACLFYCVQHSAINSVSPATHIDAKYAELLLEAKQKGVQIIAYKSEISPTQLQLSSTVDVIL